MVKFKSTATPLEMSIVTNAVEVEPNRVEFRNVTFGCKEIKDASGNVFTKIIRCKDCREFRRYIDTDITFCDRTEVEVKDDDFCSYGERKE